MNMYIYTIIIVILFLVILFMDTNQEYDRLKTQVQIQNIPQKKLADYNFNTIIENLNTVITMDINIGLLTEKLNQFSRINTKQTKKICDEITNEVYKHVSAELMNALSIYMTKEGIRCYIDNTVMTSVIKFAMENNIKTGV